MGVKASMGVKAGIGAMTSARPTTLIPDMWLQALTLFVWRLWLALTTRQAARHGENCHQHLEHGVTDFWFWISQTLLGLAAHLQGDQIPDEKQWSNASSKWFPGGCGRSVKVFWIGSVLNVQRFR
jgi:hypothetical protein